MNRFEIAKQIEESGFNFLGLVDQIHTQTNNRFQCQSRTPAKIKPGRKPIISEDPQAMFVMDTIELHDKIKEFSNNKYKYLLNVVDHFSKFSFSFLLSDKSAERINEKLLTILNNYSLSSFLSDNGLEFKSKLIEELFKENNINHIFGRVRHTQTQGSVEAFNKTIHKSLFTYILHLRKKENIETILSRVLKTYNNRIHSTTKIKPVEAIQLTKQNNSEQIEEIKNNMLKAIVCKIPNVKIGDKVLIFKKNKINLIPVKTSKRGDFLLRIIPGTINEIEDNNDIHVRIDMDYYKYLLKKGEIYIFDVKLMKIISEELHKKVLEKPYSEKTLDDEDYISKSDSLQYK